MLRLSRCVTWLVAGQAWMACQTIELHFEHLRPGTQGAVDGVRDGGPGLDASDPLPVPCPAFPNACPGAWPKCTLLFEAQSAAYRSGCVRDDGVALQGQACSRSAPGYDTCQAGNFCSAVGLGKPDGELFACRGLCSSDAACAEGSRCLKLEGGDFGVCLTPCQIFDSTCLDGARCVAGQDVEGRYFGYCSLFGSGEEDASCADDTECGEALVCEQSSTRCRVQCDAEHACPEDRRCVPLGLGDPESPRLCVP